MRRSNGASRQSGAVLIIGLILMLVASIVAMSSMRGSSLQENLTASVNNKAISHMAAEAGGAAFWDWLQNRAQSPSDWGQRDNWKDEWRNNPIPTTAGAANNVGAYGYYWVDPTEVSWTDERVTVRVRGQARTPDGSAELAETVVLLRFDAPIGSGVHSAFGMGLFSDDLIDIRGNANFDGNVHSNGNVSVTGGNNSLSRRTSVTASGNADVRGGDEGQVVGDAGVVEVPSASDYIDANKGGAGVINSCTIPSGDLGGAVYYCSGDLTTSGEFSNVTILVDGNVTHGGASQLGGEHGTTLTVAIIAKGDITVNGRNTTYGVFWTDGELVQNGSSVLGGSIVAKGRIRRNGVFNYVQYDDFGTLPLPIETARPATISAWSEIIDY